MKVAVWSPQPPSPSGIADYAAEQLPFLRRVCDAVVVSEEPTTRPEADVDLYHLGNSPAHAYIYRAALARPGIVLLHDWSLHHLVLGETVERGDVSAYLREMRRAHGEAGAFVGRQVARALGGDLLPALYPLNERILEGSLAIVGLTEYVVSRATQRLAGRPVLHLRHHVSLPEVVPTRDEARRALGLPLDAFIVTVPGLATASKRLDVILRVVARLRGALPQIRLVVAGAIDPHLPLERWISEAACADIVTVTGHLDLADFIRSLAAADVVAALRFPTYGEISGALVRALGVGRPVLVTAGTPASEEFPEGVVVPVDPGPLEEEEVVALLDRLATDASLREGLGQAARAHMKRHHDLEATVRQLATFVSDVVARKDGLLAALARQTAPEGRLLIYFHDEVRRAALDLGLAGVSLGHEDLLRGLVATNR